MALGDENNDDSLIEACTTALGRKKLDAAPKTRRSKMTKKSSPIVGGVTKPGSKPTEEVGDFKVL